jgi:hypothetical protein
MILNYLIRQGVPPPPPPLSLSLCLPLHLFGCLCINTYILSRTIFVTVFILLFMMKLMMISWLFIWFREPPVPMALMLPRIFVILSAVCFVATVLLCSQKFTLKIVLCCVHQRSIFLVDAIDWKIFYFCLLWLGHNHWCMSTSQFCWCTCMPLRSRIAFVFLRSTCYKCWFL